MVFSERKGLRLVEVYDPEPYVSTSKVSSKVLNLYDKFLIYELYRGVVSLSLAENHILDLETAFERYLQLVKEI